MFREEGARGGEREADRERRHATCTDRGERGDVFGGRSLREYAQATAATRTVQLLQMFDTWGGESCHVSRMRGKLIPWATYSTVDARRTCRIRSMPFMCHIIQESDYRD